MTIMLRHVPPLARLTHHPEMTPVVPPHRPLPLPAIGEVAPMYFDADDVFNLNDHPKAWNLPDGAVALLSRSAEWSARNLTYGFVPAETLERFGSDPVQAAEELCRRGLWRRVKGGYQFADWGQFGETAEQKARRDAEAEAKRAYDAARQRKSREHRKASHAEKIRDGAVTGDVAAMSHVTSCDALIDRSDQDQSIGGQSKSKSGAQARESPELVTAVADAICAKVGYVPTDGQAREVIAIIRQRARESKTRIRSAIAYIPAAITNEPDLWDGLLLPKLSPIAEIAPPPTGSWDPERHEYEPTYPGGPCRCSYTRSSPRHSVARAG